MQNCTSSFRTQLENVNVKCKNYKGTGCCYASASGQSTLRKWHLMKGVA